MNNLNVNDEDVRRIVREEMARASPSNDGTNIYKETQSLIRNCVKSEANPNQSFPSPRQSFTVPPQTAQHTPLSGKRSITQTGHPWRLKPTGGKAKKPKPITEKMVYAWLLDYPNEEDFDDNLEGEYRFSEDMVLTKGYVKLSSDDDYLMIQCKLLELFHSKFPEVQDFAYLKRERQKLSVPLTPTNWQWGFNNLKALMGQGKLYCRLNEKFRPNRDDNEDVDHGITSNTPSTSKTVFCSDNEIVSVSDGEEGDLPDMSYLLQQKNTH